MKCYETLWTEHMICMQYTAFAEQSNYLPVNYHRAHFSHSLTDDRYPLAMYSGRELRVKLWQTKGKNPPGNLAERLELLRVVTPPFHFGFNITWELHKYRRPLHCWQMWHLMGDPQLDRDVVNPCHVSTNTSCIMQCRTQETPNQYHSSTVDTVKVL